MLFSSFDSYKCTSFMYEHVAGCSIYFILTDKVVTRYRTTLSTNIKRRKLKSYHSKPVYSTNK